MKKVSADKFNQVKAKFNFVKLEIELAESKDITFYGCEISNTHVLVIGVYNSDIATCAHITKGEIIECNGKYIIDNLDSNSIPDPNDIKIPIVEDPMYPTIKDSRDKGEESYSSISDDRLGAIDAVNYGEPENPRHVIPEFKPPKEEKPSKVDELILAQRKQNEEKARIPIIREERPVPKSNPVMTTGRAFDTELRSHQEAPKKESAIFKKESKPAPKQEPQRNKNPQTVIPEPKKVVVEPEPSDSGFGCWG